MSPDLKAKLAQLMELHELGLLTEFAFQQQRQALRSAAMGPPPVPAGSLPSREATRVESSAPAPTPSDLLAGSPPVDPAAGLPSRLGSYRVLGIIGAGGMGTVVRARHGREGWAKQQGGDVALKLIHPHIAADPSFQERFFARTARGMRVQHPGVATVYDVVSEGPWLGTILEYVEGKELTEFVQPGGRPVDAVVSLLAPLAEALDHLHSQGIVHRDLKPANVKVRPNGQPVLLNLGIAQDLSGQGSGPVNTMPTTGPRAWMAPEQADATSVTAAADVYAVGLIAYALLSGRMPWEEGASDLEVLTHKSMGQLASLSSVAPGVSEGVSSVVMGALSVEAGFRPSSCVELVASLDAKRRAAEQPTPKAGGAAGSGRAAGPFAHTHRYTGPVVVASVSVERTREVVVSAGFFGFGREVREETYTAEEHRSEQRSQERTGERFEVDGCSLVLVSIPAGTYEVGCDPEDGTSDEHPKHPVRLSRAYSMGIHPVSQGVYQAVMGRDPSRFSGTSDSASCPVERMSWFDAVDFCNRLSERCGLAPAYRTEGRRGFCDFLSPGFRLPTEHEWEVAARAGTRFKYAGSDDLDSVGWFKENSSPQPHAVEQKSPNSWGLYDLSGNVWEWCWDRYHPRAYQSGTMADPTGVLGALEWFRILRGGGRRSNAFHARVSARHFGVPYWGRSEGGFRLARTLPCVVSAPDILSATTNPESRHVLQHHR